MSQQAYALSLFFHISATVIWIGGLTTTVILVWPEVHRTLANNPSLHRLLARLRARFFPISNLSLVVLVITGLFQMSADPNYNGLLQFNNDWSRIMLLKHLTIFLMVISGLILQYGITPELERISLQLEHQKGNRDTWHKLRRREVRLTWLTVILGMLVLGFSALAVSI